VSGQQSWSEDGLGPAAASSGTSGTSSSGRARRRDIEGLRALAIAGVVVYHARPSVLGGGYVGVDVFFVVSGFLITGLLWRELEASGSISASRFYAARARRLLPSSALVTASTVIASALLLSPLQVEAVVKDALAASFYVANYRFALESSNYLTAGGPLSPLQHYWSLGVEEQFYLLWPLVLLAGSLVWSRRGRAPSRLAAALVVGAVALASFALCWHLTATDEPWAFYALPSRAFELALGGLVALGERRLARLPRDVAAAAGWVGLALIVVSMTRFDAGTAFPGSAVLAPVLGTAGVIAAGCARPAFGPGRLLDLAPLQWLGGISYCLYLWHYPVLVLAPDVLGHPLAPAQSVVAVAFALALAVLTSILVEQPLRYSTWLNLQRGWSLVTGGALSVAAAAIAVLVLASLPSLAGTGTVNVAALSSRLGPPFDAGRHADRHHAADPARPARHLSPNEARIAALDARIEAVVAASANEVVPSNVQPPLATASADEPSPMWDGCFDGFTDTEVNSCDYGDTASSRSIVLFGDSHAMMWFPAIDAIANQRHYQLVALAKATCPPLDLEVFSPDLDEWYWQCDTWREAAVARIEALHPAVVILGFSREYGVSNDQVLVYGTAWMNGLAEMIRTLRATGAKVVVMGPVPYPPFLVPDCLAAHLDNPWVCSMPDKAPWYVVQGVAAEEKVVEAAGGSYVDVQPWFCTTKTCLTLIGNIVAYRDDNHITATYASWLTPAVAAVLDLETDGEL
jgi:peptidoglycan/LPS O-acetylase OafA/YrhL